ncbi:hypothetical protein BDP81DRAFT_50965 [Colletotrichum phormii]|uniref:Uncharacterized protein n=1 Tax=Colletotrichum phormii TaxID=359342 RepID=A0AAJ0ECE4_9PEZI|nr:uncharacterized protein BDP81DRAFT_50965 [Colletotrichum phormii]KAK1634657.1 hypothetical protein BDP81DRAFT_50965 [Colletotrichum phormii]
MFGGDEFFLPGSISKSTLELHYYRTPSWAQRLVQATPVVYSKRPNPASTHAKTRCSISSAVNTASINKRRGGNESVDAGSEDRTRATESTRFRKVGSCRAESCAVTLSTAPTTCVWACRVWVAFHAHGVVIGSIAGTEPTPELGHGLIPT